jgi:hypothetical protein
MAKNKRGEIKVKRKVFSVLFALVLVLGFSLIPTAPAQASGSVTEDYGDVTLSGGFQSGNFPHIWDLTQCDLVISFIYDANGLVDDSGAHAWAEFGVRAVGYGNFNPTWMTGGAGVWLATDYDWTANTFDPDPIGSPTQDLDDKLILQRGGGMGEGSYDLPSTPPNPWANYAVWFDRDGVDPWQALMWGAIDGATYNTVGLYNVVITLHATSDTSGTAYMTVNGESQGFYVPNWHAGAPELYPAGMTFTGDMTQMQVFYGLYGDGATHSVAFNEISVTGCLYWTEVNIDIKPGSDPNSINLKSKGVVPVAVLTTPDFDASTVDPDTVFFADASPVRWTMEDVDSDGDMDMLFHFNTQELNLDESSTGATLTGDTSDPTNPHLKGTDTVNIVPKGK